MTQLPQQSTPLTFVIRIWHDWSLSGSHWRGRIEHLQSGQHAAFEELDQILPFIRSSGGLAENKSPGDQEGESGDSR